MQVSGACQPGLILDLAAPYPRPPRHYQYKPLISALRRAERNEGYRFLC